MAERPSDPASVIREALRTSLLHRPELDHDPASFADFTGSGLCEPNCEGCVALAALAGLEREAAERETALAELQTWGQQVHDALDGRPLPPHPNDSPARIAELRARVREVEAERDRLKDALPEIARQAQSLVDDPTWPLMTALRIRDRALAALDIHGDAAIAVLASPEAPAAEPPPHPCPAGDECALNRGARQCKHCGRNWPPDETWAAALPAVDAPEKPWDGHDLNHLASILFDHALVEIQCDHDKKTDRPICACSLIELGWHPSVGAALRAWVDHVMAVVRGKWSADALLRRASAIGYEGLLPAVDAPPEPRDE